MRRTLLAVGFAVLVSMLLAPHGDYNGGQHTQIEGFGPFFISGFPMYIRGYDRYAEFRHKADVFDLAADTPPPCLGSDHVDCYETRNPSGRFDSSATIVQHVTVYEPAHCEWIDIGPVMIDMLILQAIFLAILFAVLVNLRKSWRRNPGERK